MKKIISCLVVLALVCTTVFASTLQIGGTARFGGDFTDIETYKEFSNYDFGVDTRLNFGLFGVAANVLFGKNNDHVVLNPLVTANVHVDFKVLELAFGLGYALPVEFGDDGVVIDGKKAEEFLDVLKNSQLLTRVSALVDIGRIGVGLDYTIPLSTIIDYAKGEDLKNLSSFKQGKVAFSVLVTLF